MYSYLHGTILSLEDGKVHLLVQNTGLGFEIHVSPITLAQVRSGEERPFHIHHHITEVSQTLFGFDTLQEKELFKKLLKISGIGGKTAISMLGLGVSGLARAIEEGDEKMIATVPGIGKKMALKVILELKNQVSADDLLSGDSQKPLAASGTLEITDALVAMGYDRKAVEKVVADIPEDLSTLQEKTVYCIRALSK